MRGKLLQQVLWCSLRIAGGIILSCYAIWRMFNVVGEPLIEATSLRHLFTVAGVTFAIQIVLLKLIISGWRDQKRRYNVVVSPSIERTVARIAKKKQATPPEVLVTAGRYAVQIPTLLPQLIGRGYLIVSAGIEDALTDNELSAVVADSLRKDGAVVSWVMMAFHFARYCCYLLFAETIGIWCLSLIIRIPTPTLYQLGSEFIALVCWSYAAEIGQILSSRANAIMTNCMTVADIGNPEPLISAITKLESRPGRKRRLIHRIFPLTPSVRCRVRILSRLVQK